MLSVVPLCDGEPSTAIQFLVGPLTDVLEKKEEKNWNQMLDEHTFGFDLEYLWLEAVNRLFDVVLPVVFHDFRWYRPQRFWIYHCWTCTHRHAERQISENKRTKFNALYGRQTHRYIFYFAVIAFISGEWMKTSFCQRWYTNIGSYMLKVYKKRCFVHTTCRMYIGKTVGRWRWIWVNFELCTNSIALR